MKKYLPHAVICDVDGTVALRGDRGPYDYSTVHLDLPNKPIGDGVGITVLARPPSADNRCYRHTPEDEHQQHATSPFEQ